MYRDRLKLCWLVYIFEDEEDSNFIVRMGPFMNDVIKSDQIRYLGNIMKLSVENIRILENIYRKTPIYEDTEIRNIFTILIHLLKNKINDIELIVESVDTENPSNNKYSDKFTQYDFAERNYETENMIMKCIEKGTPDELERIINDNIGDFKLPARHRNDPIRNAKNLALTLNSISARAALRGGLNPSLVHSISTKYALLIENQVSIANINNMNIKILYEYCKSVRDYSLVHYSEIVKKSILYVRRHLNESIGLIDIADELHINRSYLSRVFKKETGKNITDYIHMSKINESLELIKSKSYDISEISDMFGYCNAAYYSTKFKEVIGVCPREMQNQNIVKG
jgi:YesN/AraC family two-component response regulator